MKARFRLGRRFGGGSTGHVEADKIPGLGGQDSIWWKEGLVLHALDWTWALS
jgi:hypothetical protein